MGKIVKYCAECEEGFAEKFSFCPNCASSLTAYEMNPAASQEVSKVAAPVEEPEIVAAAEPVQPEPITVQESEPVAEKFLTDNSDSDLLDDGATDGSDEAVAAPETNPAVFIPAAGAASGNQTSNYRTEKMSPDYTHNSNVSANAVRPAARTQGGLYHITFVEEKNASARNLLLLGAFILVTTAVFGGIVYSLFKQNPYIGSLSDNDVLVAYTEDVPAEEIKPDMPEPKKKDDGGGGGGGGDKQPVPVSKGVLASQSEKPLIAPSVTMDRVTKPDIPIRMETQGNRQEKPTDEKYGSPTGQINVASDGMGSGGGQGSGSGRGQGSGIGTGAGSGIGSGNGNGRGNGNGNGDGDGDNIPKPPEKPKPPVVEPFRILSKPRANYTDVARQNQVTGVVRVRVVFLPSGAIGSVTPMNNLPYGLTDQAIAAAKQIKFEPQKSNGVPVPVTKVIEYSFSIY